jgi:hypothetical protein
MIFEVFTAVTVKNITLLNMARVRLVKTYISEEFISSIFRVERIKELGPLTATSKVTSQRINTNCMTVSVNVVPSSLSLPP